MPGTVTEEQLATPLRGHQAVAVDNSVSAFLDHHARISVVMATGTGKTLVALHIAHRIAPHGNVVLFAPNIQLLYQTAQAWQSEGRRGLYLIICHEEAGSTLPAGVLRVGSSAELAHHAARAAAFGPLNVFCTYQSQEKIEEAHRDHHLARWDLIICDEAHRTAGDGNRPWARVLDDALFPARRRLHMTATPRVLAPGTDGDTLGTDVIASMDDPRLYGPVVCRLSLAESIAEGLLADYEIVAVEVTEEDLRRALRHPGRTDATSEGLRLAAAQVALLQAQHLYDLRRTLTFHTYIADASVFAETLAETAQYMPPYMRCRLSSNVVHSNLRAITRRTALQEFIDTPTHGPAGEDLPRRAVLSNCNCFTEGVDIPALDSVLFADPKSSPVQILQAIGRALRQIPGQGKIARIIVPVYLSPNQKIEDGVKGTNFHLLHQILISLSMWDELVFDRVIFHSGDRTQRPYTLARPLRADELIGLLRPRHVSAPNQIWDTAYQHAQAYYDTHHHLNVPSRHQAPDGFYLGWWVGRQRSMKQHGMLLPQRAQDLERLGIRWEHPPTSIEFTLDIARDYTGRHGHLAPARTETHHGVRLGMWLSRRRAEADRHTLPYCYHRALNEIYPWWNSPWDPGGQWRRTYAAVLSAARRNKVPFPDLGPEQATNPYSHWLADQIAALPHLTATQHELLGQIPLRHPLAHLLDRPRGYSAWAFHRGLREAYLFWRTHQHLAVPTAYRGDDAGDPLLLRRWLCERRRDPARLTLRQINALEALDMRWC
ncbi:Helicase associated domain protein (plasmid) [Streptomyces sp. NBC_00536]|uniref:DEAD/DEAH box helicase n=1 Tax=Streptomyces sp. NBC_00536 TaxID=2975769 RepID=UPI002E805CE4|nr:Helicase associated domain protein [Streptomyces sp. NBC_00536]WUC76878.1 Helicase associated domain protein [Streptomyces sp. NBC_00536]WUC83519.1 Helicase associated domain protein [Streptomyces sp. NBC_00536]WUC84069.1 Helicase associated domain protein [Streptomyces sp. NBC_00536]